MPKFNHIAALGSSFAAGPGIRPIENRAARRSALNYPHLLARRIGAQLTDLTVSGATTETILEKPQRAGIVKFDPQIRGLPSDADLVTVTAGGNDVGYIGAMFAAAWAAKLAKVPLLRRLSPGEVGPVPAQLVKRATTGLEGIVAGVRHRAPNARILLVDYFTLIGNHTASGPNTPFTAETLSALQARGQQVADIFREAANRSGAELVRLSEESENHDLGSPEPWVTGFRPQERGAAPFHPNIAGMRSAAELIHRHLEL